MNKVEEVARAIDPAAWEVVESYCALKGYGAEEIAERVQKSVHIQRALAAAKRAIAAMEKPTEGMLREGQRAMIAADLEWRANACYQAAIRAALSEAGS